MDTIKYYFKNFLQENNPKAPKEFKQLYAIQDIKITLQLILIVLLLQLLKGV